MKHKFTAYVWQEGDWFVAQCLEVDIASQGKSEAEAVKNLSEAIELYFEAPMATLTPTVHELQIELHGA